MRHNAKNLVTHGSLSMYRWRHLTVAVGVVPALFLYIGVMLWLSSFVTEIHAVLDFLFFVIAGLAWIPAASYVVKWLARHEAK